VSDFGFHPELFAHRTLAIETLARHDYNWFEHFDVVDLLHDVFGLEVCGIEEKGAKPEALPPARVKADETRGNLAGRAGWLEKRTGKTA
jgi:hypothetical protein